MTTNTAAKKAAPSTGKGSTIATTEGVVIAEQKHVEAAPKAPAAKKATPAKKAAAKAPVKQVAPAEKKVAAPKVEAVKSYDLESYKALKRRGSDAINALMYEARLRTPKATKDQATAVATVDALIKAYGEWVRLAEEAARPLEEGQQLMAPEFPHVEVALVGADGNAFAILGTVQRAMRAAGVAETEVSQFYGEATSGDYDHLLQTVMATVTVS